MARSCGAPPEEIQRRENACKRDILSEPGIAMVRGAGVMAVPGKYPPHRRTAADGACAIVSRKS